LYVTYWALVVGLSSLVYKFFEEPILKYRDRRYRDPSDANFLHASRPVYQDMVG
jgi:peptidoglycan/LPS O-acetylase OafA/YrhL